MLNCLLGRSCFCDVGCLVVLGEEVLEKFSKASSEECVVVCRSILGWF